MMTGAESLPVSIQYDMGTLLVEGYGGSPELRERFGLVADSRVGALRCQGWRYRELLEHLVAEGIAFEDGVRGYEKELELTPAAPFKPYPHQREALAAWLKAGMAGVVVLPTGSGKTYLATMCLHRCRRAALVVVPTLDLVSQWVQVLERTFPIAAGIIGGGEFQVRPVTVITYDSAVRHIEHLGNRFGLLVFDECHHLPGEVYSDIARLAIAPFRLGLTATPERADQGELLLDTLIGPRIYTSMVSELAGDILAPYETVRLTVELTTSEDAAYREARGIYLGFCRAQGIRLSNPGGWSDFLRRTARSREGRAAFEAYRRQRDLPLASAAKFGALEELLARHRNDRTIIFTHVNEVAYRISRQYLIPVITHQTPPRERVEILQRFASGRYPAVVTSKVLNEGVDVPEANVAIVLSGSGSVREHVQRLGRILRRREGKRAVLYEIVSAETHEHSMSFRRSRHEAYGKRRKPC